MHVSHSNGAQSLAIYSSFSFMLSSSCTEAQLEMLLHFDVSYICMSILLSFFAGISDVDSQAVVGPLSGPWLEP